MSSSAAAFSSTLPVSSLYYSQSLAATLPHTNAHNQTTQIQQIDQFNQLVDSYRELSKSQPVSVSSLYSFLDPRSSHRPRDRSVDSGGRFAWNASVDCDWEDIAGSRAVSLSQTNCATRRKASSQKLSGKSGHTQEPALARQTRRFGPIPKAIEKIREREQKRAEDEAFAFGRVLRVPLTDDDSARHRAEARRACLARQRGEGLNLIAHQGHEQQDKDALERHMAAARVRSLFYGRGCPAAFNESTGDRVLSQSSASAIGNPPGLSQQRRERAIERVEKELRGRDYDFITGVKIRPIKVNQ